MPGLLRTHATLGLPKRDLARGSTQVISVHPMGFFGNFAVALMLVGGLTTLLGRRRRDEESKR